MHPGVDDRRHLELVIELLRGGWPPDGFLRPTDLRDVGEIEDRDPIPRLRHRATAAFPHGPHVPLEGIEVPQARRLQDGRAEAEVSGLERGLLGAGPPAVGAFDDLAEVGHSKAACQQGVERGEGLAVERRVVCELWICCHLAAPRGLEVEPP